MDLSPHSFVLLFRNDEVRINIIPRIIIGNDVSCYFVVEFVLSFGIFHMVNIRFDLFSHLYGPVDGSVPRGLMMVVEKARYLCLEHGLYTSKRQA